MAGNSTLCQATTRSGSPCQAPALPGETLCWAHSERYRAARQAGAMKGGKGKSRAARLKRLMPEDLTSTFDLLRSALMETHDGSLKPQQASAMSSLASAMCRVLESGELAGRVTDLETRLVDNQRKEQR